MKMYIIFGLQFIHEYSLRRLVSLLSLENEKQNFCPSNEEEYFLGSRNKLMTSGIETITRFFFQSIRLNLEELEKKGFYRYFVYQLKQM